MLRASVTAQLLPIPPPTTGTDPCAADHEDKIICASKHYASKHPRKTSLATELAYFRKHRKRMRYVELQSKGLMIGSGVVEAACKTLVTQRLKQSVKTIDGGGLLSRAQKERTPAEWGGARAIAQIARQ